MEYMEGRERKRRKRKGEEGERERERERLSSFSCIIDIRQRDLNTLVIMTSFVRSPRPSPSRSLPSKIFLSSH